SLKGLRIKSGSDEQGGSLPPSGRQERPPTPALSPIVERKIRFALDANIARRQGGLCFAAPSDHEMKNKQAIAYSHRSWVWFAIHVSIYRRVGIILLWQFCGLRPINHVPPQPHRGAPGSRGSSTSSTVGDPTDNWLGHKLNARWALAV